MFVIVRKIRIVAEDCVLMFVMYFTLVISDLIGDLLSDAFNRS